ncbi:hypothetical protein MPH_07984 [Macrophomina phaseolina MS6]|uniref:Uncharacterized protein n=1 Tax=Macrophomina phaseolina (strain MS6) TaxID=1126212 RepID=K2QY57_MACPH|nr:hypothetical protein MPH_07984 [Macrophomina phaseolina MS6]
MNAKRDLQKHRLNTRNLQAELMTELRQICLKAKDPDYEALFKLYDKLADAHDTLGALEEDYEQNEERYDILVWQLEKEKRDLVGDILQDMEELEIMPEKTGGGLDRLSRRPATHAPEPAPAISSGFREIQEKFRGFGLENPGLPGGTKDERIGPMQLLDDGEAPTALPEGTQTQYTDQLDVLLAKSTDVLEGRPATDPRRASEPVPCKEPRLAPLEMGARARSESDVASMQQPRWPNVRAHIDQWMLESLKASQLEKAIAKAGTEVQIATARVGAGKMDKKTWWGLFKQYWSGAPVEEGVKPARQQEEKAAISNPCTCTDASPGV